MCLEQLVFYLSLTLAPTFSNTYSLTQVLATFFTPCTMSRHHFLTRVCTSQKKTSRLSYIK